MVIVRFPSIELRRRALAYLMGRFSGRSWATGEVMVPEPALAYLAAEGIAFSVEGPATYDRILRLDGNTKLLIDVEDSAQNRAFFVKLKENLKRRFQQLEIYITSHLVEVI